MSLPIVVPAVGCAWPASSAAGKSPAVTVWICSEANFTGGSPAVNTTEGAMREPVHMPLEPCVNMMIWPTAVKGLWVVSSTICCWSV